MRHDPLFTSWLVRCETPEDSRRLQEWLPGWLRLDATISELFRELPEGLDTGPADRHCLSDYFAAVRVLRGPADTPSAFRIIFHRQPKPGRFWKDVLARILKAIRGMALNTVTTLEYRGDDEPAVVQSNS